MRRGDVVAVRPTGRRSHLGRALSNPVRVHNSFKREWVHDDGVARLYRTVEKWHQWRLGERAISTEKVEWEKVDRGVRELFLQETGLDKLPRVLALHHARLLDHIMNGGVTEDEAVLRDLLQKRNHSILAHGLQPIEKKSTVRYLEYVEAPEAGVGAEYAAWCYG